MGLLSLQTFPETGLSAWGQEIVPAMIKSLQSPPRLDIQAEDEPKLYNLDWIQTDRKSGTKGAKKAAARGSRGKNIRDSNENALLREAMNTSNSSMDREDSKERDK